MAGFAGNRYYNDPALGAAFANLAQAFAPPSAQDMAAFATAQKTRDEAARLAQLFAAGGSPSEQAALIGVQTYGATPQGFTYKVDQDNATQRYGYDTQAATSTANNAADNARALETARLGGIAGFFGPLGQGETRPAIPADVAGNFGLGAQPSVSGLAPEPKLPQSAQEYLFAQQQPGFEAWLQDQSAGPTEYGLAPVYGRDAQGNIVVMQLGKDGSAVATQLPEGVSPDLGVKRLEEAKGAEVGKQTGAAAVSLSADVQKAQTALDLIDSIAGNPQATDPAMQAPDPALDSITGIIQGRLPPLTQAGTDLNTKIDQLKGQAFLEAFSALKGGGQITELEGKTATDAIARLNRAQSPEAFLAALADLRAVISTGMTRAQQRAAGAQSYLNPGAQPPAVPAAPQGPVRVNTPEEAMQLPPGTKIILPDGTEGVVPNG